MDSKKRSLYVVLAVVAIFVTVGCSFLNWPTEADKLNAAWADKDFDGQADNPPLSYCDEPYHTNPCKSRIEEGWDGKFDGAVGVAIILGAPLLLIVIFARRGRR